jgi:hypothetical protein
MPNEPLLSLEHKRALTGDTDADRRCTAQGHAPLTRLVRRTRLVGTAIDRRHRSSLAGHRQTLNGAPIKAKLGKLEITLEAQP